MLSVRQSGSPSRQFASPCGLNCSAAVALASPSPLNNSSMPMLLKVLSRCICPTVKALAPPPVGDVVVDVGEGVGNGVAVAVGVGVDPVPPLVPPELDVTTVKLVWTTGLLVEIA